MKSREAIRINKGPLRVQAHGKRSRVVGPKSSSGCLTCKIRRVKCDEARPSCKRCVSTGRKCDGYIAPKEPPKMGNSELTVWHAIIAVSSVHRHSISSYNLGNDQNGKYRQVALDHYNKAIVRMTKSTARNRDSVEVILVTCLLFVCLELLLENVEGAMTHVHSGGKILLQALKSEGCKFSSAHAPWIWSKSSAIEDHVVTLFRRLGNQVNSFERADLKHISENLTRSRKASEALNWKRMTNQLMELQGAKMETKSFGDIADARNSLIDIWNDAILLGIALKPGNLDDLLAAGIGPKNEYEMLLSRVSNWSKALKDLLARHRTAPLDLTGLNLCELQHKFASIWISTALSPLYLTTPAPEDVWDSQTKGFESVISLAEAEVNSATKASGRHGPVLTFEMGIILPVYTIALVSRDPGIRRRALDILEKSPRREGFWNSKVAARMAERAFGEWELERCSGGPYGEIGLLDLPRKSTNTEDFCPGLTGNLSRKKLIPQYTADRKFTQKELNSSVYFEEGRRWETVDSS